MTGTPGVMPGAANKTSQAKSVATSYLVQLDTIDTLRPYGISPSRGSSRYRHRLVIATIDTIDNAVEGLRLGGLEQVSLQHHPPTSRRQLVNVLWLLTLRHIAIGSA